MQHDYDWHPQQRRGVILHKRAAVRQFLRVIRDWRQDIALIQGQRRRRIFRVRA